MTPELHALVDALLRCAKTENVLVGGFLIDAGAEPELLYFTTARERGGDYVQLYRQAADMLEDRMRQGLFIEKRPQGVM
jgi:hypothetical protein